ncbi:hypothetical protein CYMTET_8095, partial [Cymbomonas tetramitiformis]|eukprot:gene26700-32803_t
MSDQSRKRQRGQYEERAPSRTSSGSGSETAPKIISVYNYKGGVGKTTIAVNTAARFAQNNERTLIIDFDSQCNATSFFQPTSEEDDLITEATLSEAEEEENVEEEEAAVSVAAQPGVVRRITGDELLEGVEAPDMDCYYNSRSEYDILELLGPVFGGFRRGLEQVPAGDYVVPARDLLEPVGVANTNGCLFLIRGCVNMGAFLDEALLKATAANIDMYYGAFRAFFLDLAVEHGFKYIVLDLSPSACLLNQLLVMSSDFVIPPAFPDFFSTSSVCSLLKTIMPKWITWQKRLVRSQQEKVEDGELAPNSKYLFKKEPPKFLPILATNYKKNNKKVTKGFSSYVQALRRVVLDSPPEVQNLFLPTADDVSVIAFVQNLGAAHQLSHQI